MLMLQLLHVYMLGMGDNKDFMSRYIIRVITVYVKIFVVDLILLFSWLASIHENFSLSEVSPTKIFPTNFFV